MEQLEKYFDTAFGALDGIKTLKVLILRLAMSGHFSNESKVSETAIDHLNLIKSKKQQLFKKGQLKNFQEGKEITPNEIPHLLPSNWQWVRFIEVLDFQGGSQPPKQAFSEINQKGFVQLIQIRDLGPNPQPIYVSKDSVSKFCTENDIMIGRYGASVGKVFWGKNGAYNVALIKLIDEFDSYEKNFLYYLMVSPIGQNLFSGISRSAQDGFSKDDIAQKLIPLPPHKEQINILHKIAQLMSACDNINQLRAERHQKLLVMHTAAIRKLLDAPDQETFDDAWQFITRHFGDLYTVRENVAELRKAILQLAVMGKLHLPEMQQENAKTLLELIKLEKSKLNIKINPITPIKEDEIPFNIPKNWAWCRIEEIATTIMGGFAFESNRYSTCETDNQVIRIGNVKINKVLLDVNPIYIDEEYIRETQKTKLKVDDILITMTGTRAKKDYLFSVQLSSEDFKNKSLYLNQRVGCFRFSKLLSTEYINLVLKDPRLLEPLFNSATGSANQANVGIFSLSQMLIPLPPYNEQQKITERVNLFMALCDELENQIEKAGAKQQAVLAAVLS